jgi:hypothetical protein
MNKEAEQFLQEGIFRYADAYATVAAFEKVARAKVEEVARDRTAKIRGGASKELVETRRSQDVAWGTGYLGRVAWATFPGTVSGEKVIWETGIWWEDPDTGSDVSVYLECSDSKKGPPWLKTSWAKLPERNADEWNCYEKGLELRLAADVTVEKAFDCLFEEAARQLKSR